MLGAGIGFMALSDLAGFDLIAEGAGFVLVGLAGTLVSRTAFDRRRDKGDPRGGQDKVATGPLAESHNKMSEVIVRIDELQNKMFGSRDRMYGAMGRIAETARAHRQRPEAGPRRALLWEQLGGHELFEFGVGL